MLLDLFLIFNFALIGFWFLLEGLTVAHLLFAISFLFKGSYGYSFLAVLFTCYFYMQAHVATILGTWMGRELADAYKNR